MSEQPDQVLMDVEMPVIDGLQATRRIGTIERSDGGARHVPIIALRAHAMKRHREQFLAAGTDGYVAQLIRSPELMAATGDAALTAGAPQFAVQLELSTLTQAAGG